MLLPWALELVSKDQQAQKTLNLARASWFSWSVIIRIEVTTNGENCRCWWENLDSCRADWVALYKSHSVVDCYLDQGQQINKTY